jgi:hypothetical protein
MYHPCGYPYIYITFLLHILRSIIINAMWAIKVYPPRDVMSWQALGPMVRRQGDRDEPVLGRSDRETQCLSVQESMVGKDLGSEFLCSSRRGS